MAERVFSYAQNREDIILSAFFLDQPTGFYVDVGANDPTIDSVTKYFYDRGWHGINIEPSPVMYKKLVAERPRDINLNIGISNKKAKLKFREYQGVGEENFGVGLSTFSEETKQELAAQEYPWAKNYKDHVVAVERLDSVFAEQKLKASSIDFLKIDVEGYEYEVVTSNDWTKYRPKVVCIEANHIHKDWPGFLQKNNYKNVFNDGLNDYFVDDNRSDINFSYIEASIGRDVFPAHIEKHILKLEQKSKRLADEVRLLHNENIEQIDEINRLHTYISLHSGLRTMLKDIVRKAHTIILLRLSSHFKTTKKYPAIDMSADEDDPKAILAALSRADHQVLTSRPLLKQQVVGGLARLTYLAYRGLARSLMKLARLVARMR